MKVTRSELMRLINESIDEIEMENQEEGLGDGNVAEDCIEMLTGAALGKDSYEDAYELDQEGQTITFANGAYLDYDIEGNKVDFQLYDVNNNEVPLDSNLHFRLETELMELLDLDVLDGQTFDDGTEESEEWLDRIEGERKDKFATPNFDDYESGVPVNESKNINKIKTEFFRTFHKINKSLL